MKSFNKKSKSTQATLEQNGMNTDQYLALHINKRDLPEGSQVVVMIRDEATGEVRPIPVNDAQKVYELAQKSKFYGKTMADGHIFNPYIHRRFIAVQFEQMIRQYGYRGIKQGFAETRNWDYAIGVLKKEVHVLATLERKDMTAFKERSRFFTLGDCFRIIYDYARGVKKFIEHYREQNSQGGYFYLPKHGMVKTQNVRPMQYRFQTLITDARACKSYAQLDALMERFDWLSLVTDDKLPDSFVTPYLEAGAYYTLKHHMMFQGLTMWRESQHESLLRLRGNHYSYLSLYTQLLG